MTTHMTIGELARHRAAFDRLTHRNDCNAGTMAGHALACIGRLAMAMLPFSMLAWTFIMR